MCRVDVELDGIPVPSQIKAGSKLLLERSIASSPSLPLWSASTTDGVKLADLPVEACKLLPVADRLLGHVRSIRRSANVDTCDLILRISTQEALRPLHGHPVVPADQADESGFLVTQQQLSALAEAAQVRHCLQNPHLQKVLRHIDSCAVREKGLEDAMHNPAFHDFAENVLQLLRAAEPSM